MATSTRYGYQFGYQQPAKNDCFPRTLVHVITRMGFTDQDGAGHDGLRNVLIAELIESGCDRAYVESRTIEDLCFIVHTRNRVGRGRIKAEVREAAEALLEARGYLRLSDVAPNRLGRRHLERKWRENFYYAAHSAAWVSSNVTRFLMTAKERVALALADALVRELPTLHRNMLTTSRCQTEQESTDWLLVAATTALSSAPAAPPVAVAA